MPGSCGSCRCCSDVCPLGAIDYSIEIVKTQQSTHDLTRSVDLNYWKQSPYVINQSVYRPFTEENIIFARVLNDPSFADYQVGVHAHLEEVFRLNKKGYSRIDEALSSASWAIYDHFTGAFSWKKLKASIDARFDAELEEPADVKVEIDVPHKMTKIVKHAAKAFGAALVGVCKLNRDWLYTHDKQGNPINIPDHIENAIVIAVEMDLVALQTTPAFPGAFATGNGYSRMAFIQACLAEFIRGLGYDAIPAGNNIGLSVPLAIDAGVGQYGRHGLLITPQFGSNVRICKVLTNLPLASDKSINFGALDFCRTCKRCAEACPSQSISYDRDPSWSGPTISNNPGVLKWYVNAETCYHFWTINGNDCSVCITSCPFTKNRHWSHGVARFFIKHFPWLNRLWVKLDKWLGYGKQLDPDTFWDERKEFIHSRKGP